MLAYFCKYVPEELFQAFGTNITCMEPHVTTFTQADALMHPNMCSFSKAVLEEFEKQDYDGMIFTSCCDSSRRLYDILRHLFPDKFFFCLDLPRKINDFAVTLYTRQLEKLIDAYTAFSGKTFSEEKLLEICRKRATEQKRTNVSRDFDASAWQSAAIVCLLYTSDAADEEDSVDLGGRRNIQQKKKEKNKQNTRYYSTHTL